MSSRSIACGTGPALAEGHGRRRDGLPGRLVPSAGRRPPRAGCTSPCGRRGRAARRSCRPSAACTKSTMRFQAAIVLVVYMPAQPWVMRPSAETSVISVKTRPAPPDGASCRGAPGASPPPRRPPAEYWHIGETTMRFSSSRLAQLKGREDRRGGASVVPWRRALACSANHSARARPAPDRAAQVVVGDALRARHQVEGEGQRILPM